MRQHRIRYLLCSVALFVTLVTGCSGEGQSGSGGRSTDTSMVRIQLGSSAHPQQRGIAASLSQSVLRQRIAGIPSEVDKIVLHATVNGVDIPGSPMPIPLTTGTASVTIDSNTDHRFVIQANNQRGDTIFQGQKMVNLPPDAEVDVPIVLEAISVVNSAAALVVGADTGGEVVVPEDATSPLRGLRLSIPAEALDQDMMITVDEIYNPSETPGLLNRAGVIVDLGPSGTTFASPITLTLPYDENLLQDLGIDEAELAVFRFNPPPVNQWAPLPNQTVDTVNNIIIVSLNSFSLYSVAGPTFSSLVNRPPVADPQLLTLSEDTAVDIFLSGSDADEDTLTFPVETGPSSGTLSGMPPNVMYIPNDNFNGSDTFTFVISDDMEDSVPANDAPVAANDAYSVAEDTTLAVPIGLGDTFAAGSGGLDGPAGLIFGPDGDLYVSSRFTDAILRYDGTTGEFLEAFVPPGSGGLDSPTGLVFTHP